MELVGIRRQSASLLYAGKHIVAQCMRLSSYQQPLLQYKSINRFNLLASNYYASTIHRHNPPTICQGPTRYVQTQPNHDHNAASFKKYSDIPGPTPFPLVGNIIQFLAAANFDVSAADKAFDVLFKKYGPIMKLAVPFQPVMVISVNPDDLQTIFRSTMHNPTRDAFEALKQIRDNAPNNYFNKNAGLLPDNYRVFFTGNCGKVMELTNTVERHAASLNKDRLLTAVNDILPRAQACIGSDGGAFENGDEWWRLRKRVQAPLLRPKNVATYLPKVDNASCKFVDRIELIMDKEGKVPDDFIQELYKWSLECVGLVALDRELGCLEPNLSDDSLPLTMIRHVNDMLSAMNETEMGLPTWRFYRSAPYVKLETAHNAFLEITDKCLKEAIQKLEAKKKCNETDSSLTVIETFLNTDGLSESDVATMVIDMLFAGVDTTSHTVAFTLYLLAKNPVSQRILQEEIDSVMGSSDKLLPEHIAKMPYLNSVVKESLRMFPITLGNGRKLTQDINMSGYNVPAGTVAMVMNSMVGRMDKYFKRANEFLPERWSKGRPHGPIHPYASVPFSHGKRMCIGKRIAEQEIYAFLIRVLQKYDISLESNREMKVTLQLVVKPAIPLAFTFKSR